MEPLRDTAWNIHGTFMVMDQVHSPEYVTATTLLPPRNLHGNAYGSQHGTFMEASRRLHESFMGPSREPSWAPAWNLHGDLHGTFMGTCMEPSWGPAWNLHGNLHGTFMGTFMEPLWEPLWNHHGNAQVRDHTSEILHLVVGCRGVCEGFHRIAPQRIFPRGAMTATMMET